MNWLSVVDRPAQRQVWHVCSGEVVYASRMRCSERNMVHREAGYLIEVHGCLRGV